MLISLVLALTPVKPFTMSGFYGRQARAWFLGEVARHNEALAEKLHEGDDLRPYTVSSLWSEDERKRLVPGDMCYLRITALDKIPANEECLSKLIKGSFLENLPPQIRIRDTILKPLGRVPRHAWDKESDFHTLMVEASRHSLLPRVTLHFRGPAAIISNAVDKPLPTPARIWKNLYHKWNVFSSPAARIDKSWSLFAGSGIAVSDFNISSEKVSFKRWKEGAITGCTGYVTYRLLSPDKCGDYAALRPGAECYLHQLAAFAQFCGVGKKTSFGLGQVRALEDLEEVEGRVMTPRYRNVHQG